MDVHDHLGAEWRGRGSLDVHPTEAQIARRTGDALIAAFDDEDHRFSEWDASVSALFDQREFPLSFETTCETGHDYHLRSLRATDDTILCSMVSSVDENKRTSTSSTLLALIPVGVGLVLGGLILPRSTQPGDVPLPRVDAAAVSKTEADDEALAARSAVERLSPDVRAAGEAIRAFNTFEAKDDPDAPFTDARAAIDTRVAAAIHTDGAPGIVALRAVQLGRFMEEVRRFQRTGESSAELDALAGSFLARMKVVGWLDGHALAMDDHVLRVAYKLKWNVTAGLETLPALAPSLDELRALYAFYLSHPHAPETQRFTIESALRTARSKADCDALAEGQRMAVEQWRVEKIDKLAKIDPEYPAAYAKGIGEYRAGHYRASVRAFDEWLEAHPDGPYSLRARNYQRTALAMAEAF